jgi:hypothetical protein
MFAPDEGDEMPDEDGEHTHSGTASTSGPSRGGRRWSISHWVNGEPVTPDLDRLPVGRPTDVVDRALEYRLSWDAPKGMWRVDTRRHVPGG